MAQALRGGNTDQAGTIIQEFAKDIAPGSSVAEKGLAAALKDALVEVFGMSDENDTDRQVQQQQLETERQTLETLRAAQLAKVVPQ